MKLEKLIEKKKNIFPPSRDLDRYLREFNRSYRPPLEYDQLLGYKESIALFDEASEDTLWSTLFYEHSQSEILEANLLSMYAFMRTEGDLSATKHLLVDRIDLCLYGNTLPFRIRISNRLNDNFEYFYIKQADSNRIVGLELEHILSPNRIGFLCGNQTLVEEHIYGIPGDIFRDKYLGNPVLNKVRLAKEFVKFNERCLLRLLGDMHASNFVFDITMDFEMNFYRIRAIDFDQQSHDGSLKVYRPELFPQNQKFVQIVKNELTLDTIEQYKLEERSMISRRMKSSKYRLEALIKVISDEVIAPPEQVLQLAEELADYYKDKKFKTCRSMGDLLRKSLDTLE